VQRSKHPHFGPNGCRRLAENDQTVLFVVVRGREVQTCADAKILSKHAIDGTHIYQYKLGILTLNYKMTNFYIHTTSCKGRSRKGRSTFPEKLTTDVQRSRYQPRASLDVCSLPYLIDFFKPNEFSRYSSSVLGTRRAAGFISRYAKLVARICRSS
jgi:hypothetical protein